jgi:hypothetical protein
VVNELLLLKARARTEKGQLDSNNPDRRSRTPPVNRNLRVMNHRSVAHPAKDKKKKKVGRTKESARKHEGPLIPRGLFLIGLSRVFLPVI